MGVQLFSELFNSVWRSGEDEMNSYCGIAAMLLLVVLVAIADTWIGAGWYGSSSYCTFFVSYCVTSVDYCI